MDYIVAALFGIIQGITEFLPVSSSGHLVILHNFFETEMENDLAFDVLLHFATILAVLIYFRKDVYNILNGWFRGLFGYKDEYYKMGWLIIISSIPAGFIGFFFEDFIDEMLHNNLEIVIFMLIAIGILFIVFEKIAKKTNQIKSLTVKNAVLIGFAQALALIPGTSRSGATIIAGLWTGLKREEAIRFSFLMSIPIILGASLKNLIELASDGIKADGVYILLTAFVFSFVFGFLSIKYLLRFAKNHSLNIFAYYRFLLAFVLVIYLIMA